MPSLIQRSWLYMNTKLLFAAIAVAAIAVFSLRRSTIADDGRWVSRVEVIPLPAGAAGPESLTFDPDGEGPYTGVSDGRILKWQGHGWLDYAVVSPPHLWEECRGSQDPKLEHLCGRPLGLGFSKKSRDLYIADAYLGLLRVGPGDKLAAPIATEAQGIPFHFANSLDIDQDNGIIYFTDSSTRFQRREYISAIIAGDKTGRLMSYNPHNKEVEVLLDGLSFPNGVALSQDGSSLLVAETTNCRILRYWLRPPNNSSRVEVLTQLPGFPDNIKLSPRGGFWVGIHSRRSKVLRWVLQVPWIGEVLLRSPLDVSRIYRMLSRWRGEAALAVRVSEEEEVVEVMEDGGGKMVRLISEVEEQNGTLWFGSVVMPFVGVYKL